MTTLHRNQTVCIFELPLISGSLRRCTALFTKAKLIQDIQRTIRAPFLKMNKIKAGKKGYFEMEEFEQATDTGIDDVVSEKVALTATATRTDAEQSTPTEAKNRQASTEPARSCRPDKLVEIQRCLYIITTVAVVSFLMSAAALILALTMMMSRNLPTASTGYATVQENKLLDKSTGRNVSVQTLLRRIQDLENKTLAMEEKIMLSVMDGLWGNMTDTHETFEKKLDTGFKLLIASIKALNNSDGELTSTMNALRQNQILTKRMSERLAVNVTQLESDVQELKKTSGNVSSRARSLERGYTQKNSLIKTLQAVNAAQNASHEDLQSLYKRLNDSLTTVNATLNDKLSVMDGLWGNMTAAHETFEKKLDTGFKLLIASIKSLNNSDGELTSTMNALRQNQILTKKMSERLAVNVTQLESDAQELKKASGNVSSRARSLERGYTQMNSLIKTLQAVNAAQNASHEDLQSLYKRLNDSLTTVNATLNEKDPNKPSAHIEAVHITTVTYKENTVIKDWSVSAPHSHLAGGMTYHDGKLTVPIPGRYYIYAQFYYHNNGRVNVLVNNRRITLLHFPAAAGSLYTGGVFNLTAGDVITLTTHFSFTGWMSSFHSYFGAFLI